MISTSPQAQHAKKYTFYIDVVSSGFLLRLTIAPIAVCTTADVARENFAHSPAAIFTPIIPSVGPSVPTTLHGCETVRTAIVFCIWIARLIVDGVTVRITPKLGFGNYAGVTKDEKGYGRRETHCSGVEWVAFRRGTWDTVKILLS